MTEKIFDDFIKEKLREHSAPVPADMFERIIQTNDPKRRVALFSSKTITSVFLLIAVSSLIGYIMWQPAGTTLKTGQPSRDFANPSKLAGKEPDAAVSTKISGNPKEAFLNEETYRGAGDRDGNEHSGTLMAKLKPKSTGFEEHVNTPIQLSPQIQKNNIAKIVQLNDYSLAGSTINNLSFYSAIAKKERSFDLTNSELLLNQMKMMKLAGIVDCPTKWPRRDWYVEAFASPDFARKSIVRNNSINENYFNRKDSTEKMEGAFTAGIRISKTLNDHIFLKAGLQYSQINEKFEYRTENERRLTTIVTIRTIIRAPGDTVRIRDTSLLEQIGYRQQITHNKYRSIDVPFILGYEWGGEKWKQSINAGVLLNLRSWQEGEMLDTSFVPVAFNKSTGQTFKTNIGMGVYLGYSLIKSIEGKMDVFVEPYIRYNIANMTTNRSLFTQKLNVAGLNLGIRYKLSTTRQHFYGR